MAFKQIVQQKLQRRQSWTELDWDGGGGAAGGTRRKMSAYEPAGSGAPRYGPGPNARKTSCYEPAQQKEWMEGWDRRGVDPHQRGPTPESPRRRLPPTPDDLRFGSHHSGMNQYQQQRYRQLPAEPNAGFGRSGSQGFGGGRVGSPGSGYSPPADSPYASGHTSPARHSPVGPPSPTQMEGRTRSSSGRRLPPAPGDSLEGSPFSPSPPLAYGRLPTPPDADQGGRHHAALPEPPAALPQPPYGNQHYGTRQGNLSADLPTPPGRQASLDVGNRHRYRLPSTDANTMRVSNGYEDRGGRLSREASNSNASLTHSERGRSPLQSSISPDYYEDVDTGPEDESLADPAAYGLSPELYRQSGSSSPVSYTSENAGSRRGSFLTTSDSWNDGKPAEPIKGPMYGIGTFSFTIQYFPVRKRLRVNIMKAEDVNSGLKEGQELHALVKLCIMPHKQQKQQSRVVKTGTKELTFNEEFFFDNLAQEDIKKKALWIRLCHQAGRLSHKDVVIGDIEVQFKELAELLSKKEIPASFGLRPRTNMKNGRLTIYSTLETEAKRLTINVIKVEDLPKGINGAPANRLCQRMEKISTNQPRFCEFADPFVKITVKQNGKSQTKQSRFIKNSCNAVYKEAVMFVVDAKPGDIDELEIIICVCDHALLGQKNELIGQVILGRGATEKTELEQWKATREHPGKEYKATHALRLPPKPIQKKE